MKIAVGADHRGFALKQHLAAMLRAEGHEVLDCGCHSTASADYPDFAFAVGRAVAGGEAGFGVLVCGTGIGVSIAANKVGGVRAALCCDVDAASASRRHNDANVLCLSGDRTPPELADAMLHAWLAAEFEGGRHARRVDKIKACERGEDADRSDPSTEKRGDRA